MFNTSRYCQTFSQGDSTSLHSHQQYHEDFSTSIPIPILFHSGGCKLLSHCNFDLHSLNSNYAFFHKFIGHLCMFFGEMSILILCPLYVACPFVVEFKSSLYILDTSSLTYMVNKNFLPFFRKSFSLIISFEAKKVFNFAEVQFISLFFCHLNCWDHSNKHCSFPNHTDLLRFLLRVLQLKL